MQVLFLQDWHAELIVYGNSKDSLSRATIFYVLTMASSTLQILDYYNIHSPPITHVSPLRQVASQQVPERSRITYF